MSSVKQKFLFGKKVGMTQIFQEDGSMLAVTVVHFVPSTVLHQGSHSLKVSYADVKRKNVNSPHQGVFAKLKLPLNKYIREVRMLPEDIAKFSVGQVINPSSMFAAGDAVDVVGVSKGKGFQGNIKRHGQSGGPATHGSDYHRRVGSMGANSYPSRVFKGKKLPGRMGGKRVTVQNLQIVGLDEQNSLIWVKGAIPGPNGSWVTITNVVKARRIG